MNKFFLLIIFLGLMPIKPLFSGDVHTSSDSVTVRDVRQEKEKQEQQTVFQAALARGRNLFEYLQEKTVSAAQAIRDNKPLCSALVLGAHLAWLGILIYYRPSDDAVESNINNIQQQASPIQIQKDGIIVPPIEHEKTMLQKMRDFMGKSFRTQCAEAKDFFSSNEEQFRFYLDGQTPNDVKPADDVFSGIVTSKLNVFENPIITPTMVGNAACVALNTTINGIGRSVEYIVEHKDQIQQFLSTQVPGETHMTADPFSEVQFLRFTGELRDNSAPKGFIGRNMDEVSEKITQNGFVTTISDAVRKIGEHLPPFVEEDYVSNHEKVEQNRTVIEAMETIENPVAPETIQETDRTANDTHSSDATKNQENQ